EVDAIDRAPGIFSARHAGDVATSRQNIDKLLNELARKVVAPPPSGKLSAARFRCVLALARDGELIDTFEGVIEGIIVDQPRGAHGFGYDPVFLPNGFSQTFAELSAEIKNRISHRAKAVAAFLRSSRPL